MANFPGLNQLYDYPTVKSVGGYVSNSYRCGVCGDKISRALYKGQDGRCNECEEARDRIILRAFSGRGDDSPVSVNREVGQQLGHVVGARVQRCQNCRAVLEWCGCAKSAKYKFYEKEWRVR